MICKKCGATLPEDTTYCPHCNTWQSDNEDSTNTSEKEASTKTSNLTNISSEITKIVDEALPGNTYETKTESLKPKKATSTNDSINKMPPAKNVKNKLPKFLVEGEHILTKAKWTLIPFIILWAIVIIAEIFLTYFYGTGDYKLPLNDECSLVVNLQAAGIALIIVTLFICIISTLLFILRRELIVTNKKIYGRIGLIGTKQFIIPLDKINYISIRYSIITRILNSALLIVYSGNSFFGIHFFFVANANSFKKSLEEEIYKKTV